MARIYAGILGPLAFVTCLARAVVHAWPPDKALLVAWTSLLAFALVGATAGWVGEWILEDEVRTQLATRSDTANPPPWGSTGS